MFPLLDGGGRRLRQQRMAAEHLQALDTAMFIDNGVENDDAIDRGQLRDRRIDWLDALDERGRLHHAADADRFM